MTVALAVALSAPLAAGVAHAHDAAATAPATAADTSRGTAPTPTHRDAAAFAAGRALEAELRCDRDPRPGALLRALLADGLLRATGHGSDGIPVFAPTRPLHVFGRRVRFVAGWEDDATGVHAPFARGPGTAPPLHIAVSVNAAPDAVAYAPRRVAGADGTLTGTFSSVDPGTLDGGARGSTLTCYGGHDG